MRDHALEACNLELALLGDSLDVFPIEFRHMKRAYRTRVKQLHPDRGGDQRRFLQLQAHFEEALALLAERATGGDAPLSTKAA